MGHFVTLRCSDVPKVSWPIVTVRCPYAPNIPWLFVQWDVQVSPSCLYCEISVCPLTVRYSDMYRGQETLRTTEHLTVLGRVRGHLDISLYEQPGGHLNISQYDQPRDIWTSHCTNSQGTYGHLTVQTVRGHLNISLYKPCAQTKTAHIMVKIIRRSKRPELFLPLSLKFVWSRKLQYFKPIIQND